mmetsp:Transcript_14198/g.33000  ORF Transcript_14198/g.33000 Transcript_14198/m.33000 type:complete len:176 (+) Transcript_14198:476-1003(+)
MQTMAPTAQKLGMLPYVKPAFFEAGGVYDADPTYTNFVGQGGLTRMAMSQLFHGWHLPGAVTEDGWYTGTTRETDNQCRERAASVKKELLRLAATSSTDRNVICVAHYDFICALLDELVVLERTGSVKGPFKNWKTFNTGITVLDITVDGETSVLMHNIVPHLLEQSHLISGFHL